MPVRHFDSKIRQHYDSTTTATTATTVDSYDSYDSRRQHYDSRNPLTISGRTTYPCSHRYQWRLLVSSCSHASVTPLLSPLLVWCLSLHFRVPSHRDVRHDLVTSLPSFRILIWQQILFSVHILTWHFITPLPTSEPTHPPAHHARIPHSHTRIHTQEHSTYPRSLTHLAALAWLKRRT